MHDVFTETLWPDHPLGRPVLGTVGTIEAATRGSVNRFYRRHYIPGNFVVAAAGNVRHEEVLGLLSTRMDTGRALPEGDDSTWNLRSAGHPPDPSGDRAVRRRKTEQAHICLGTNGLARTDPDRFAFLVVNTALGGGMAPAVDVNSTDDNPAIGTRSFSADPQRVAAHGCLRAVVEALSDPQSGTEYPQLSLGDAVQAILKAAPKLADQVAYVIGTRPATAVLDPAQWPSTVQLSLSCEFARDLLAAARLEVNGSWASRVIHWPPSATWFNKDYPKELLQYTETLREAVKGATNDFSLQEHCRHAARKVREISEAPDFASEFGVFDRWLKMQAMRTVIPILTDEVTLAWVEREMTRSSWRTRSFLLELLIHLAAVDSPRAAAIYRQAVGLTIKDGKPALETATWFGNMDYEAIEWSLAGEDGKRSLLKEFSVAFFPAALDLAEEIGRAHV